MPKRYKNVIWEGRFQPIHKGHLAYIQELLKYAENVWLVVLDNNKSSDPEFAHKKLPVPEFSKVVDEHHGTEKNPLPLWVRFKSVVQTVNKEFGYDAPIVVMCGKRLDLDWEYYKHAFPPERIFLTPTRDSYEDLKAEAWKKLGEKCERIDVAHLPKISATEVRDALKSGLNVDHLLHEETIKVLGKEGFYKQLQEANLKVETQAAVKFNAY